ncbi:type IV pilin protein [Synechococcus sp. MW101C3]|uniref:type IV pilin protein n=1 Tax=Synechococcus sp. MW101C3 TaxID=210768 RepID=UPI000B983E5D|nr:prepilin-type N-terminal cleavage/methylation domain-containing protein [Synechococcus sp. MW101C3]
MSLSFGAKLELKASLRARDGIATAFTLVELMIVVSIVGVFSAVALPTYINARNATAAGAVVGEAVGFAKECATTAASDVDTGITPGSTNVTVACTTAGGTVTAMFTPGAAGIQCLSSSSAATDGTATITISERGVMTCAFS